MSDRFGAYPPPDITPEEIRAEITDRDGSVRVNKEKCASCPFTAGTAFSYQLKRIAGELKQNSRLLMQCHNTFPSDVLGALCRGGYDKFASESIQRPRFIDQQTSKYQVVPR